MGGPEFWRRVMQAECRTKRRGSAMTGFLSNDWIKTVASDYSILIGAIPYIIFKALKIIAILNPNVPTNTVRELFSWKGKRD
jgi:hypothetical protein